MKENLSVQEYLERRVSSQKDYFSKSAAKNKQKYYYYSIAKLIISLGITITSLVVGYGSIGSIIVASMSALVTLLEGILLLCKYYENWITYRITNERLKREEILFRTTSEKYFGLNKDDAFNLFVTNIESIIQNSNKQWENINNDTKGKY